MGYTFPAVVFHHCPELVKPEEVAHHWNIRPVFWLIRPPSLAA